MQSSSWDPPLWAPLQKVFVVLTLGLQRNCIFNGEWEGKRGR